MKPFRFTLQALRTVRQRQEQVALEEYSLSIRRRMDAAAALQTAVEAREQAWRQRQDQLNRGVMASQVRQLQNHCQAAEQLCVDCQDKLRQAEENVAEKWQLFTEARRKREVVDKFYARQHALHERACAREEQKMLDELGLRRSKAALQAAMDNLWN